MSKELSRLSNMELLRSLAMIHVLLIHSNFFSLGAPVLEDVYNNVVDSFIRILVQSSSLSFVNVFVLLSGWFGIKASFKGISNFLFQYFFYALTIYVAAITLGYDTLSVSGIKNSIGNWFVNSYLLLYILSPALNTFSNYADRKSFKILLISFFLFQTILGWLFSGLVASINDGLSAISFIGLYLLARYIRIYTPHFSNMSKSKDLLASLCILLFNTFASFVPLAAFGIILGGKVMSYISPTTILLALFVLLFFSKIRLESRFINWFGASCFAVFLIHADSHVIVYYRKFFIFLHHAIVTGPYVSQVAIYWLAVALVVLFVAIISVCIDQIRLLFWNLVKEKFIQPSI